jgi:hypothetical protein
VLSFSGIRGRTALSAPGEGGGHLRLALALSIYDGNLSTDEELYITPEGPGPSS